MKWYIFHSSLEDVHDCNVLKVSKSYKDIHFLTSLRLGVVMETTFV